MTVIEDHLKISNLNNLTFIVKLKIKIRLICDLLPGLSFKSSFVTVRQPAS
jgi:hypothetical protein